jgi:hypothetical protein
MSRLFSLLSLIAAAPLALLLAPSAHAQIETFDTIPSYDGQGIIGFTGGASALTQTFTDIQELDSVTFAITNTSPTTVAQNIDAYLVQWSTANDAPMTTLTAPTTAGGSDAAPVTISTSPIESFTVPPVGTGGWGSGTFTSGGPYDSYSITLTPDQYMDPTLTYAVILIDTTNASGLGLLDVNTSPSAFRYNGTNLGFALQDPAYNGDSTLSAMQQEGNWGDSTSLGAKANYGFSQIVVVPAGNIIPVPEPRTAAAVLCGAFVALLFGRQLLLRRKDEASAAGMAA